MRKQYITAISIGIISMFSIMTMGPVYAAQNSSVMTSAENQSIEAQTENSNDEAVDIKNRFGTTGHEEIEVSENVVIMPNITREGMTLLYWSNTPDGSGARYDIGSKYVIGTDAEVYAIWSPNEFTFTMNDETIVNRKTDDGTFSKSVTGFKKGDVLDVTPEKLGIKYEFNNGDADCQYVFKAIESTNSRLSEDGHITVESDDFTVVYELIVKKDSNIVATSKVAVVFGELDTKSDVNEDAESSDKMFTFTLNDQSIVTNSNSTAKDKFTLNVKGGVINVSPESIGLDVTAYDVKGASKISLTNTEVKAVGNADITAVLDSVKALNGNNFDVSYVATVEDSSGHIIKSATVIVNYIVN